MYTVLVQKDILQEIYKKNRTIHGFEGAIKKLEEGWLQSVNYCKAEYKGPLT